MDLNATISFAAPLHWRLGKGGVGLAPLRVGLQGADVEWLEDFNGLVDGGEEGGVSGGVGAADQVDQVDHHRRSEAREAWREVFKKLHKTV